ncbi:MAG: PAS domain-containing sensor histidine kinase, partial [Chloroflexi bacterium]|nr:PAS domain-containing sensor histidine kinase [Chloroflexota bacterium]
MFNIELKQIRGQGLITLIRDYQADALIESAIENSEVQSATIQPVLSSQTLHITCYPLDVPQEYSAIVLLRDITQIAQLERARREMVANVSHELRTPLASIKLLVETLQGSPPPDITTRMLGQIADELESMTHLVDELRELSQIESGRLVMSMRPTDMDTIIERAVTRLRAQAEHRSLKLIIAPHPELPPALMDGERIGQVLLNLLNNALKFTPAGGSITVSAEPIHAAEKASQRPDCELEQTGLEQALLIRVQDTGIGIPASEADRVFERFYKVDRARTRNSGGTGLGLAIAKHLIEGHGGRIWVESREGAGSTFSFLLPVA